MRLKTIALITSLILLARLGHSQESAQRRGLVLGTSFGIANTKLKFPNNSSKFSDLALDLKIGYIVTPKLAVLLTSNVSIYDYSGFGRDRKRDFGVLAPSVQYWVKDKLWILGGIGIGGDNPVFWDISDPDKDPLETKYYSGLGIVGAVGYELYKLSDSFIIDLKAKATYRKVNLQEGETTGFSYGLLVGINFY